MSLEMKLHSALTLVFLLVLICGMWVAVSVLLSFANIYVKFARWIGLRRGVLFDYFEFKKREVGEMG